ncbi:CobW family GTP-binding protein [Alkalihalobacterium chitinilyticum]|uniref:GTP-binding protein n=1 Tax=Alkalihalobacterium chitinilyticum TaxID=2980103 RepID=A0ABT5V9V9_9BACI|nr:GTP-binding protein [Alkalihalobacterium chitinilyticum]MDE5412065.1 GTP-binding protein [Alkalihalobacterium chitinilyticum]
MAKSIPVYLITGFLGSGKTTVLQKAVQAAKNKGLNPALILNELGEVNVEEGLFDKERMVEMLNGCICCTISADMTRELAVFLEVNEDIDILFIEGTGVADPSEIIEALTHPSLIDKVQLVSTVGMVDGSKFLEYQSIFSSSKEIRDILKKQINSSSLVVLNKIDLIKEKELTKVRKKIGDLVDKRADFIETTHGEISTDVLLKERVLNRAYSIAPCDESCGCEKQDHHHHDHGHDHHHHHHHMFEAITLRDIPSVDRISFERWLQSMPKIVRSKGIIQLTETPQMFQYQYASGQLMLNRSNDQLVAKPCIILIGSELNGEEIRNSFQQLIQI